MDNYLYYKYIHSISQFNILPVTSRCNFHCLFCSHKQNPPGLETLTIEDLKPSDLEDIIDFLDPEKKIVIGESATRIIEGEPFLNSYLTDILFILRKNFPSTPLQITTNGSLIDEKIIEKLSHIKPLELHISVNTISEKYRKKILGLNTCLKTALEKLSSYNIPFSASIVALPHVTGRDELEETIMFLDRTGSEIIKIFWPSFTEYTGENPVRYVNLDELKDFYKHIKSLIKTPVILEPPLLDDVTAITEGSVAGSPGDIAGIKEGDEIISIEGYEPKSRVDAFNKINSLKNPAVTVRRKKEILSCNIIKDKGEKSGLTFLYDLDWAVVDRIKHVITDNSLIATSHLAFNILDRALKKEGLDARLLPVKNLFFGGNIACAGLLTVDDILMATGKEKNFNHLLLPSVMFDENAFDLKGKSCFDIVNNRGFKCDII
jgi:wyosine [tRNA(Phe)-imidazoG37] synthetase (radical SAM superfamily)